MTDSWPTHALTCTRGELTSLLVSRGVLDMDGCHFCGCDPYDQSPHRWNCALTPIWAQTIRELDVNPLTLKYMPYVSRNFQPQWRNA